MITIPEKTKEIVERSAFIRSMISKNLLNLSAYAREIKPEIENELLKPVSEAAVTMALKRYAERLNFGDMKTPDFAKHYGEISLRSRLFEATYKNSKNLYQIISDLYKQIPENAYLTFIKGVWQTTVIASSDIKAQIVDCLKNEEKESEINGLSSITIRLGEGHIEQPGLVSNILQKLSWEGINIIEVVSTWDELTVVLSDNDIERAFQVIHKLRLRD